MDAGHDAWLLVPLTFRLLMTRQQAESIVRKREFISKWFKKRSLTHKITTDFSNDAHFPERIVTVVGTKYSVGAYIFLICDILEKEVVGSAQVEMILLMSSSQCSFLNGPNFSKINQIRKWSEACVTINEKFLPNSDEKMVLLSGPTDSIISGFYHICGVLLESPPSPAVLPYVIDFPFDKELFRQAGLVRIWFLLTEKEYGCITGQGGNETHIRKCFEEEYRESVFHVTMVPSSQNKIIRLCATPDTTVKFVDFIRKKLKEELDIPTRSEVRVILNKQKAEVLKMKNLPASPAIPGDLSPNSFIQVRVSGSGHFISRCIYHICGVTLQADQDKKKADDLADPTAKIKAANFLRRMISAATCALPKVP